MLGEKNCVAKFVFAVCFPLRFPRRPCKRQAKYASKTRVLMKKLRVQDRNQELRLATELAPSRQPRKIRAVLLTDDTAK